MAETLVELIARIKADATQLEQGLTGAEGKAESSSKKIANSFAKIGKAALAAGAIAVVAFAGKALKSAIEFEDQMANVAKTTGLTGDALSEVQKGIQGLARSMPVAHEELAGIAAVAGQLGIQGKEDIVSFTETAAMMATAFDMSGEEAATAMAKLANIYDIPIQQTDRLASAINVLGNTTAAKEGEIIDAMSRVGASGKMLGLLETQVASMVDQIIAAGMAPERAGTQLRSAFSSITQNVGTAADVMGVSVEELTKRFDTDFHGALIDLLNTLETKYPSATERMVAMTDLFGETGSKAMSVLSSNTEGYLEVLGRAEQAYQENTALQEEYANKTNTLQASLQRLSNLFNDISIIVGEKLYPLIEPLVEQFGKLLESLPVDEISEFLNTALQPLVSFVRFLLEALKPLFPVLEPIGKIFAMLAETLSPFLEKLLPPLIKLLGALVEILVPLLELVLALLEPFLDLITYILPPVINLLTKLLHMGIEPLTDGIRWLIDHALKPLKDIFAKVGEFSDKLYDKIIHLIGGSPGILGLGEAVKWTSGIIGNTFSPQLDEVIKKTTEAGKVTDNLTDSYNKLGSAVQNLTMGPSPSEVTSTLGRLEGPYLGEALKSLIGPRISGGFYTMAHELEGFLEYQKTQLEYSGAGPSGYKPGGWQNIVDWVWPKLTEEQKKLIQQRLASAYAAEMQTGGIVTKPTLSLLGEAGPEAVIPLNEVGTMGNVTIQFTQPVFFDREDTMNRFVDMIRKGIQRQDRLRFGGAYNG